MIFSKNKTKYFISLISIFLLVLLLKQDWYRVLPKKKLTPLHFKALKESGEKAIDCLDIPISSILIYKNKIIGKGYNSIIKDYNAGGHAEINAISNALKNIGHQRFSELNRDSLTLITTYEPCLMCKGAIINNRIKNISFIERKGFLQHFKYSTQDIFYEFHKRKSSEDTLQKHLFKLHPDYPGEK